MISKNIEIINDTLNNINILRMEDMKRLRVTMTTIVLMSLFAPVINAEAIGENVSLINYGKKTANITVAANTNSTKTTNADMQYLGETIKKYKYFKLGDNNTLFIYVPATYHMLNSQSVQYKRYSHELDTIKKNFYAKNKDFAKFYIIYDNQMSYNEFEKLFKKQKSNKNLSPLTIEESIANFKYFKIGKDGKIYIYTAATGDYLNKQFYEENKIYTIIKRYQPFQKDYEIVTTLNIQMEYDQWKNMVEGKDYTVNILNGKDKKQVDEAKKIKPVKDVKSSFDDKFSKEFLSVINQERKNANLQPLTIDASMTNLARWKAHYMNQNKSFNHKLKDGSGMKKQIEDFGIQASGSWAENIAYNMGSFTAEDIYDQWYSSDGHRRNMMNPNFTKMGIGVEGRYISLWLRSE